ncbi:MAG TPA: alpha-amylase/4-alpha-glucanotransferase domain-containing protein [Candidatus Limnocylindrales bacterium]|nr:alpha-amylase/4-alpha-glucanotransferase domain-containing protein [Candidatus Limnocylindrales bacterium]
MSERAIAPVRLAIAIHNHQPVGNFDSVFAEAVERAYRPFLDALTRHPGVRLSMHWSGPLYEWLEGHDPSILDSLGALVSRGQVELLSGAYYEPILAVIPPWDQQGQLERMGNYLKARFGVTPRGAWIAERVWEPDLPDVLSRGGIEYTLLDDHHFLLAGADPDRLREPYRVESTMGSVGVFPIERELRYRIPFQPVPELLGFLREGGAGPGAGGFRVFGDDGEKFGIWPRTHDWVYGERWLDLWLTALEERREIEAVPLGDAWDSAPPVRTIALPAASYPEMMLWSLPAPEQARIEAEQHWLEGQGKPELARRIATGNWREFLARYPESRRLHRRVSELSARIEGLSRSCLARDQYDEARREVHRAQCNCSYWHGVFGGFYLPHLRESVRGHMLRADALADALQGGTGGWVLEEGEEDLRLKSRRVTVGVEKASGAIVEIAERRRPFDFACVIARRREAYHARVEEAARHAGGGGGHAAKPETIHGAISMKEPGLERLLQYDERPRVASQEWLLPAGQVSAAGGSLSAAIGRGPAGLRFAPAARSGAKAPLITLASSGGPFPGIRKEITGGPDESEFEVGFTGIPAQHWLITEWNLSLLTADAPGRRLLIGGAIPRAAAPGSTGEADSATSIRLEDSEYLRVALTLEFEPAARVEWLPIETVSLSEAGAERVYQGTAFVIGFFSAASGVPIRIRARIEEAAGAL